VLMASATHEVRERGEADEDQNDRFEHGVSCPHRRASQGWAIRGGATG
jgi:hypothetical protein